VSEQWKDIADWPGYSVSDLGRVQSPNKILNPCKSDGYPCVTLYHEGKRLTIRIHLLVWYAFKGSPASGYVVHHKSHDRGDARLDNLHAMLSGKHTSYHWRHRNPGSYHNVALTELYDDRRDDWGASL